MADLAIEIVGVDKYYGGTNGVLALKDMNLSIRRGEFVSLIGPSGCGKTTLLKIVDGLLPYDEGVVLVNGSRVTGPGPDRAVVFQDFALLPWLTVRENVAFGLELQRESRSVRQERPSELIRRVGLDGFADAYPRQLSGGMQQRVGLARALAVDPDCLLMDEPFGSVDALTRNLLQEDLLRVWEASGKTVLFVTHDMDEAVFLSDRIVIMGTHPGHIVEILAVDIARPRTLESRRSMRAMDLTNEIWEVLRSEIAHDTKIPNPQLEL